MTNYICVTCGAQFAESDSPPQQCPICEDERQYVGWNGQQWTTLEQLRESHRNLIEEDEPGLTGIVADPVFAIGQRARLLQAPSGNVLWDCASLLDEATVAAINKLGGVSAIAISHPHFCSSMVEWSQAFGGVPIYLHADNREWVLRHAPEIVFWEGERYSLGEGLMLVRCGGHFPGSTVLHWAAGAGGKGVLLTGDTIYVVSDRRYVTFMYSYPNAIPLSAQAVRHLVEAIEPLPFDRLYSSWKERVVQADAHEAVRRSADRYIQALSR